jgi:hypothetical protein
VSVAQQSNYAFKPIAEQALRPNQTIVPQRLNAALDLPGMGRSLKYRAKLFEVQEENGLRTKSRVA